MLQINLKHFLYFLFCAIYKSRNTLKIVQKEIVHHPMAILAVRGVMLEAAVLLQQTLLLLTRKILPE
jgi:hypothetical protein